MLKIVNFAHNNSFSRFARNECAVCSFSQTQIIQNDKSNAFVFVSFIRCIAFHSKSNLIVSVTSSNKTHFQRKDTFKSHTHTRNNNKKQAYCWRCVTEQCKDGEKKNQRRRRQQTRFQINWCVWSDGGVLRMRNFYQLIWSNVENKTEPYTNRNDCYVGRWRSMTYFRNVLSLNSFFCSLLPHHKR